MENLQKIWARGISSNIGAAVKSQDELKQLLTSKVKTSVSQINRNMLIDAIIALAIGVGMIAFTIYLHLENQGFVIASILLVIALLIIHYRVKYRYFNKVGLEAESIKKSIEKLVKQLTLYKKIYFWTIPSLTALLFTIVHILLFNHLIGPWLNNPEFWVWEAVVIPITASVFLIVKLLFNYMYGKQLMQLKGYLKELGD